MFDKLYADFVEWPAWLKMKHTLIKNRSLRDK
jgi:hypothetical protein